MHPNHSLTEASVWTAISSYGNGPAIAANLKWQDRMARSMEHHRVLTSMDSDGQEQPARSARHRTMTEQARNTIKQLVAALSFRPTAAQGE